MSAYKKIHYSFILAKVVVKKLCLEISLTMKLC